MGFIHETHTLGHIIRYFKAICSYEIHNSGLIQTVWQRNYYERIIRNEAELKKIREYIINNPIKCLPAIAMLRALQAGDLDHDNPMNI